MTSRSLTTRNRTGPSGLPVVLELEERGVRLTVVREGAGTHLIALTALDESIWMPLQACTTRYSLDLIRSIFSTKIEFICDEIAREEDPGYVEKKLRDTILMYVSESEFEAKRVLDFGCGCGASSLVFSRLFPSARIVGVELEPRFLEIARMRGAEKGYENLSFFESSDPASIPADLGEFDHVVLSAVFEHMLPVERKSVMAQLWSSIKPGGILFVNQTPNRLYPVDHHTTGLPFINYLPDRLALKAARKFSPRVSADESWQTLLRQGIRGATVGEVLRSLNADDDAEPEMLTAKDPAIRTFGDYWLSLTTPRMRSVKRLLKNVFNMVYALTDLAFVPPELHLAIRKSTSAPKEKPRP